MVYMETLAIINIVDCIKVKRIVGMDRIETEGLSLPHIKKDRIKGPYEKQNIQSMRKKDLIDGPYGKVVITVKKTL